MRLLIRSLIVLVLTALPLILPPVPSVAAFKYLHDGMTAPTVEGKDLRTGQRVSTADRSGDPHAVTCVAFWATWSPRSIELLSDLKALHARLKGQPFRIIAVNVDSQVTTSDVEDRVGRMVDQIDPPFPVIMDHGLKMFYEFGVVAVPSTAILDADGVARATPAGYSDGIRDRLGDMIEVALGLRAEEKETTEITTRYHPDAKASRYYHLAVQLTNQGHFESALDKLEIAITADPRFSAPHNLRGHIELELGDVAAALESFRHAIALDSISVAAHAGLGRALLENKDTTGAKRELEIALELEPSYPSALRDLGVCLAAREDYEGAISTLREAIALNARDPELYYHIGRVYRLDGRTRDALDAFHSALRMRFPGP